MNRHKAIITVLTVILMLAVAGTTLGRSRGGDTVMAGGGGAAQARGTIAGRAAARSGDSSTAPAPAPTRAAEIGPSAELATDTSTTAPGERGDPDHQPSPSVPPRADALDERTAEDDARREVLPGAGGPPPATPTDPDGPIGDLGDDRPVPAGFDLLAPPAPEHKTTGLGGPTGLTVAPSCSHQCITKGVAHARGFGAELVVEAELPVQFYLTVIADPDGDGDYEESFADWTPFGVTSHSWALDHLLPGQTYHVMVAATDDDNHTAYAWGEFTTLSHRTVVVEIGQATVTGGPSGVDHTTAQLGLNGTYVDATPGQQGILIFPDLPRHLGVDYWLMRWWDDDLCESWSIEGAAPHGGLADACVAWNSAVLDDVDLDAVPEDKAHWTKISVTRSLHPPVGDGGALPPGYGDPYYFAFEASVTFHVTYS